MVFCHICGLQQYSKHNNHGREVKDYYEFTSSEDSKMMIDELQHLHENNIRHRTRTEQEEFSVLVQHYILPHSLGQSLLQSIHHG